MNIFFLDRDPVAAAKMHCDKHLSKMCIEYAQLLSTAHRVVDGVVTSVPSKSGRRMIHRHIHPDQDKNERLYLDTHVNHPSNKWSRESSKHYLWLYQLYVALCEEFEYRYNKPHGSSKLSDILAVPPAGLDLISYWVDPPLAMKSAPNIIENKTLTAVEAYRQFYHTKQGRFKMVWTKRESPKWWKGNLT